MSLSSGAGARSLSPPSHSSRHSSARNVKRISGFYYSPLAAVKGNGLAALKGNGSKQTFPFLFIRDHTSSSHLWLIRRPATILIIPPLCVQNKLPA
jgi:hypothetical protein